MNKVELSERYEYVDGVLYRKTAGGGEKVGGVVGYDHVSNGRPYRRACFNKKHYYLHQIIFVMHYGTLPDRIDHIDGDSLNNRIENLRPASQSENIANSRLSKSNTSGFKGVVLDRGTKTREVWIAQIGFNSKCIRLGRYQTKEDAAFAYAEASTKLFGEFSRPERTQSANNRAQDRAMQ